MLKTNEMKILTHLRANSRATLSDMSRLTGLPVSTVFHISKRLEKKVITKYASIIDTRLLDFFLRVNIVVKAKQKLKLQQYLLNHANVNSLYRCTGHDYYIETVFRDMAEYYSFLESLDVFQPVQMIEHHIISDVSRERLFSVSP